VSRLLSCLSSLLTSAGLVMFVLSIAVLGGNALADEQVYQGCGACTCSSPPNPTGDTCVNGTCATTNCYCNGTTCQ
jgi:hypothetical protein